MYKLALGLMILCTCLLLSSGVALAEEPTPTHAIWLPLLLKSCCAPAFTPTATRTVTVTATTTATPEVTPTVTATPALTDARIAPECSQWDAPGNENDNLSEEYVCLENVGSNVVDMTGWHIRDVANNAYTFPAFTLAAGASVRLRTGPGADTATDLYWGRGQAVWNNGGDTVYLYDAGWGLVDEYRY